MSSQHGRRNWDAATPAATAAACGLGWVETGKDGKVLTWDAVLDLAVVAYWERRESQPCPSSRVTLGA